MKISIVATGEKWVDYDTRPFLSVIKDMISNAKREITLSIYILSDKKILEFIKIALEKGISTEVFTDYYSSKNLSELIEEFMVLKKKYKYLKINIIKNALLHAKVIICDDKVLIGSANLTKGGLIKNYELGFLVEDKSLAKKTKKILKKIESKNE